MFLSETEVNNQMYMKVSFDRNQFIVSGMLQMPLVMKSFMNIMKKFIQKKIKSLIEETGSGKIMYKISNFSDNDDVKIIDKSGPFEVIEYQRDLSVMPEDAQLAFFCSQMNVRKCQLKCELSRGNVTIQSGAMQWMAGDVSATTGIKGAGDFLSKTIRGKVTGESVIKPEYTGDGTLVLEPSKDFPARSTVKSRLPLHAIAKFPSIFTTSSSNVISTNSSLRQQELKEQEISYLRRSVERLQENL